MKRRDEAIDILKGMLVFGMILNHVSALISNYDRFPIKAFWLFSGLVTFSGFVFCFGYVCQFAYFGKDLRSSYRRMLMTALKPLIAFYISGIYWRAFIDKELNVEMILNILLLKDIPPYSEFLVSFSILIGVSIVLFKPIQIITENQRRFWLVFGLLLLTTFIPYRLITINQIGLFIGTEQFSAFPVLQYFPIYLLGIYFAKYRVLQDRRVLFLSISGWVAFVLFYLFNHQIPSRFPPSLLWILASLFWVYLYYLIARKLLSWQAIAPTLNHWGQNVLFYLLVSNILIFTFRGTYAPVHFNPLQSFGITLLILFTIQFLATIVATQKSQIVPIQLQSRVQTERQQEVGIK